MLYDKNWEKPAIKLAPWQKVLLDAADLLEHHGWIQGSLGCPRTGMCAVGAITHAAYGNVSPIDYESFNEATRRINQACGFGVEGWNDTQGRTKEQVINKLKEAADVS